VRYQRQRPGELVHLDVKKQGRIPDGGGHRVHGRQRARGGQRKQGLGYDLLHVAVDDCSRVAYLEVHPDEQAQTVAGFTSRALGFYGGLGITVERVLTDNGNGYRSRVSARCWPPLGSSTSGPAPTGQPPTARPSG
jgi:Integrase core domain